MKLIKTFKTYNDTIINEFLKQSNGKIVNYKPLVIEYDDENTNFKDPYKGLNAYRVLEGTVDWSDEKPFMDDGEIDDEKIMTNHFNTICFDSDKDLMVLMYDYMEILTSEDCAWLCISFKSKYMEEYVNGVGMIAKTQQHQYPTEVWEDVDTAVEIYMIEDVFIEAKHPKLNYDF